MTTTTTIKSLFSAGTNVPAGSSRPAPVIGPSVSLVGGYGAVVTAKLANGSAPGGQPTIEIQISTDGTNWRFFDQMFGDTVANSTNTVTFRELHASIQYVRGIAYGNNTNAVTVDGEVSLLTGL